MTSREYADKLVEEYADTIKSSIKYYEQRFISAGSIRTAAIKCAIKQVESNQRLTSTYYGVELLEKSLTYLKSLL